MKRHIIAFVWVIIFCGMTAGARAAETEPPVEPFKWRQPPDMQFGVNIRSTEPDPLVADDWRCMDPGPVTGVHFWGSFVGWQKAIPNPTTPPPNVDGFWIRIFKNVPAGVEPGFPYSHPGEVLYRAQVNEFQQNFVASILLPDGNYEHKFYYSLDLPEPFVQEEGAVYWVSISAIMPDENPPFPWGWETSTRHWNGNATRYSLHNNYWEEIAMSSLPAWYQEIYSTVDMAFELTVAYQVPAPPEPVKWKQRPDMIDGINVVSNPTNPPDILTVADDWLCPGGSPVTGLHFWGSYLNWNVTEPDPGGAPPGVEGFRIRIFSDRPATADDFSRPDLLLYEARVGTYNETFIASIPVVPGQSYEHKFKYDLELPRIFWQKRNRIYWLNISAVPQDPQFPWGWESSMDRWNDFAVEGFYIDPADRNWLPIVNPLTDDFIDMSFELTTCKGPIKWLQFPDMAAGFSLPAYPPMEVVADDWLCLEGKPVTEIQFWGTYLDPSGREYWEKDNSGPPENPLPPTPDVDSFRIGFHEDVPAGVDPDMPWSHPGELLREELFNAGEVVERYWDSVPHVDASSAIWWEHKFYYIIRLNEPFLQEQGKIYWLSIAAHPSSASNFVWGWETSTDHWNDDAASGNGTMWRDLGGRTTGIENLTQGMSYNAGDVFYLEDEQFGILRLPISVEEFQLGDGTWYSGGNTTVVSLAKAGGAGNELSVNNVNLDVGIATPLSGLSLLFGKYGGNLNIKINGAFQNFDNFAQLDGLLLGGVQISVVNGFGDDMGSLSLKGSIEQFSIGGQELFIDDIKADRLDMAFVIVTEDNTEYCQGDLDRDGDVDPDDLRLLAEDFGRNDCYFTGDCEADFKYDGDDDGLDLQVFMNEYGRNDCPCALPVQ